MSSTAALPLEGKHALVVGVDGPLARPAAVALAEAGATVSLFTRADDRAQEVEAQSILNECWSLGRDGQAYRLDSTDPATVEAMLDSLEAQFGPIFVLVAVHPAPRIEAASEATREAWDAELARTATSVAVPVLSVGRRMLRREGGRIVNVVSSMHQGGDPRTALFAAAEAAVLAFTRSVDVEWSPLGVRVLALITDHIESGSGPHAQAEFREALRDLATRDSHQVTVLPNVIREARSRI